MRQIKKGFLFGFFMFLANALLIGQLAFDKAEIIEYRAEKEKSLTIGERAPLTKESIKNLDYFKAKKKYKVEATFTLAKDEKSFEMPTYSGITKSFIKYGTLSFKIGNKELQLALYRNLGLMRMPQYKNHLFLPYKDKTSSKASYGGGRYIDIMTTEIKDGKVILDFNKSYNPWCAYGEGFNCPVPPQENILPIAIKAGEKQFLHH